MLLALVTVTYRSEEHRRGQVKAAALVPARWCPPPQASESTLCRSPKRCLGRYQEAPGGLLGTNTSV